MEEKVCPDRTPLLKKAKWAIRKSYWFNCPLPAEYHSILINQECCSEYCMRVCLQNCSLTSDNEVLLFDKYGADKPDILIEYIRIHGAQEALLLKLIETKNIKLLICFVNYKKSRYFHDVYVLSENAQIALVNSNDPDFFWLVLSQKIWLTANAFERLLQNGNYDMFETYCKYCYEKGSEKYFYNKWLDILLEHKNEKAIELVVTRFRLDISSLVKLVEHHLEKFVEIYFRLYKINKDEQCFMVNGRNKKLIALYIKNKPFAKKAQIELVKSGCQDLLRMHYLKYGLDDEVIVFQASLNNVKTFLNVQ